jgi:hypothetical protein
MVVRQQTRDAPFVTQIITAAAKVLLEQMHFVTHTITRSQFMYARISALLLVLALVLTANVNAQERFGTLQGRVTDQQGAAIPGVTVSVTSLSSGETRTFVTDTNGQFVASDLNPGRYKVGFELSGFTRVERPDVSVVLGRTFEMDTQLSVGGLAETVQVTA